MDTLITLYLVKYLDLYISIADGGYCLSGRPANAFACHRPPAEYELDRISDDLDRPISSLQIVKWNVTEEPFPSDLVESKP